MSEVLSKTYQEKAQEWVNSQPENLFIGILPAVAVLEFAKHLDSFTVLDDKLQLLAYQKAREIDREVLLALASEIDGIRVKEIISGVYSKHYKHNTKSYGE